ncbi:tyrosine-protein phosphatase [Lactobacillus porci]|uniref:Tyrosine-protein phosphatase n=1 Tax=Lactobacillus porci TaxID=2012477 RepID=A0A6A8MDZ6_9LACO|nr:tyrosine-protein phosphatase [Lactobacillus porci]MST87003.1 tyrosine-protein phosphatase [Lactobacillus porci]
MQNQLYRHLLDVKDGRNFRELGGYRTNSGRKIKTHKLIRSGHLADLTKSDERYLAGYGLKYDVDLRTSYEREHQPDKVWSGLNYFADPVFDEDLTDSTMSISDMARAGGENASWGFKRMLSAYENMATGQNASKAYRHLFELLLQNEKDHEAVLFHCTAGKDRTGFGAILILSALGVPMKTIERDYLFTNEVVADFVKEKLAREQAKGAGPDLLNTFRDLQTVKPAYFKHLFKTINASYGSINAYLHQQIGLSSSDLLDLRAIYLEY